MIILTAKIIILRFFEIFFIEALISAVIAGLSVMNAITDLYALISVLFIGIFLFMGLHFLLLRSSFTESPGNLIYFVINLTAYALFAFCTLYACKAFPSDVYTWLFAVTKFMRYILGGASTFLSAVIFLLTGFFMIFAAPLGARRVFIPPDEKIAEDNGDYEEEDVIIV